jgi:hypothetical protein
LPAQRDYEIGDGARFGQRYIVGNIH